MTSFPYKVGPGEGMFSSHPEDSSECLLCDCGYLLILESQIYTNNYFNNCFSPLWTCSVSLTARPTILSQPRNQSSPFSPVCLPELGGTSAQQNRQFTISSTKGRHFDFSLWLRMGWHEITKLCVLFLKMHKYLLYTLVLLNFLS